MKKARESCFSTCSHCTIMALEQERLDFKLALRQGINEGESGEGGQAVFQSTTAGHMETALGSLEAAIWTRNDF